MLSAYENFTKNQQSLVFFRDLSRYSLKIFPLAIKNWTEIKKKRKIILKAFWIKKVLERVSL